MATTGQTPLVRSTDPLRHEHADLLPRIEDLRATADAADVLDRAALGFLRGHLVPHAQAEEAALYPAVERALGAPGSTATMSRDHVEGVRLVGELAEQRAAAGHAGPDLTPAEADELFSRMGESGPEEPQLA